MIRKARNIGMACMLAIAVAGAESVPAYAQSGVFYKGGAKEIITTSDDFFRDSDMTQMLPGDVYEGKAKIDNSSRENVKLFFRTAPDRSSTDAEGKQMLADFEISVMLRKDGKESTIYKGRTSGEACCSGRNTEPAGQDERMDVSRIEEDSRCIGYRL